LQGLLVALQNASPKSLIVVFTDNGSKDLDLEREIVRFVHFLPEDAHLLFNLHYQLSLLNSL
jgi:hypothetical protein